MTLLLGRGGALGGNELEERRLERSLHVDEEIVGIAEKYVTVTELLGRREEETGSAMPSSLQATLGVEVEEEEDKEEEEEEEEERKESEREAAEYSEIDSKESLYVGKAIVKTSNR